MFGSRTSRTAVSIARGNLGSFEVLVQDAHGKIAGNV